MDWFNILKEQRQVARNVQSFKPIQFDKPIKLNKPEKSCEEKFIERARAAAIGIGFNSFDPYSVSQAHYDTIKLETHKLNMKFYYINGSSAFKNRSPTPTDALADWGTYLNSNEDVTDDLFCLMMSEYDKMSEKIGQSHADGPKKGPFEIYNQKYTNLDVPFVSKVNLMSMFRTETNQRVATLYVTFEFRNTDGYSELTNEEMNMHIKKHFPNWSGSL